MANVDDRFANWTDFLGRRYYGQSVELLKYTLTASGVRNQRSVVYNIITNGWWDDSV